MDYCNHFIIKKTLEESMIDKNIDDKEALQIKEIYNHYLDKRKIVMKKIKFKVEDVFGDIISKDSI